MPARTRAERASARDARAKAARAFINKTVPALLKANARARKGVEAAERIVDPPPWMPTTSTVTSSSSLSTSPAEENEAASKSRRRGDRGGAQQQQQQQQEDHEPPCMHITLRVEDTLEAAARLVAETAGSSGSDKFNYNGSDSGSGRSGGGARRQQQQQQQQNGRVAVLNMASPLRPGGGVLTGATSQEEQLCARTTLYPSLRESFYRLPEVGGVYTPDVLVCRSWTSAPSSSSSTSASAIGADAMLLPPSERFYVDVLTAAMLRMPDTIVQSAETTATSISPAETRPATQVAAALAYAEPQDRELAHRKMRAALRILRGRGATHVVLGAWGCGAYGNPVGEVARAWRAALCGRGRGGRGAEGWDGLRVVFAIRDAGMARAFADAFGQGLVVQGEDEEEHEDEGEERSREEDRGQSRSEDSSGHGSDDEVEE
ncbi:hypothetical protein VFPFJ_01987 [Purpureocillium lilacinum]|uniref:Microbial-type PARG catalytic domain-containing protein n=1 Tax=Purpureocillium lilacinum TaxID=33203 RepID=A0A179HQV0_PURLI|nr:hypothetical protein VFPFJ_01987 [Purpureocillium lilacinum]OAQ92826.1 hypothetical protein VFPFJ_01987 [Purpureocillium lilacinum]